MPLVHHGPEGWEAERPYDDLPLLPPQIEIETRAVLKQCIESRSAMAELKVAAALIPNPTLLLNTIPLLEAQASSEIENIVTTADKLFQQLDANNQADPATREALRYRRALLEGANELNRRPLSTRTAEVICTHIQGIEMSVRRVPGTQLLNTATGEVIYTPPVGEDRIRRMLANWEAFLHEEPGPATTDPLVRMAIAHYQFEAIHPFTDGNGRTGRILNTLYLVEQNLLSQPILYLSRYIIRYKSDYYRLLQSVTREHKWEEWILFILRGIENTARWTTDKIAAIRTLATMETDFLRKSYPKLYSRDLLDIIFEQPYCRIRNLVDRKIGTRQLASRYLHGLVEAGVLLEVQVGREKLFLHARLLKLLTRDSASIDPLEQ